MASNQSTTLTFFEGVSIVSGFGIGGGVMAVPYLAAKTGIVPLLLLVIVGFAISLLLHLLVAEIMLRDGQARQLVEVFRRYWSVSFALAVIVEERTNWGVRCSWLAATVPSLLVVVFLNDSFLSLLQLTGGSLALFVAVMLVPLYRNVRISGAVASPEWTLGRWSHPIFQGIVLLGIMAMAVGSLQPR